MAESETPWASLSEAAVHRVAGWLATSAPPTGVQPSASEEPDSAPDNTPDLLDGVREDVEGLDFTRRLFESVVNAGDPFVAALGLRELSKTLPNSLSSRDKFALKAGGVASLALPWAVLPVARKWLRDRVSHLALSAELPQRSPSNKQPTDLKHALNSRHLAGMSTAIVLSGQPILGNAAVAIEVERLRALAEVPEVHVLNIDPARLVVTGPAGAWSLDSDIKRGAVRLAEVLESARAHDVVVVLEPADYRGAALAVGMVQRIAQDARWNAAKLGMVLPAELPESTAFAEQLVRTAHNRVAMGGVPLELTIGVLGFSPNEQIHALITGLAVATLETRLERSAQMLRLLDIVLPAASLHAVQLVLASEDPHLIALSLIRSHAHSAQVQAKLALALTVQLRSGTAPALAATLVAHDVAVRQRLPIAAPHEFIGLIDSLLGMAAESAEPDSLLARISGLLDGNREMLLAEQAMCVAVCELADQPAPTSHRLQRRALELDENLRDTALFYRSPADADRAETSGLTTRVLRLNRDETGMLIIDTSAPAQRIPVISTTGFANEPDTDSCQPENRTWVRSSLGQSAESLSLESSNPASVHSQYSVHEAPSLDQVSALIDTATSIIAAWAAQPAHERSVRVARLAYGMVAARDRITAVLAAESGQPAAVIDAEIGGAIDAARFAAELILGLDRVRGATFVPSLITLVVHDAGVPLAQRAEAVLAALATGAGVLWVTHPSQQHSSGALLEEWCAAGLPAGLVTMLVAPITPGQHEVLAVAVVADLRVGHALVSGSRATADALLRRRPDIRVEGRFLCSGAVMVSGSADITSSVRGVVDSAFGAAATDPRVAQLVLWLGAAAGAVEFQRLLADAVRSLRVGDSSVVLCDATNRKSGVAEVNTDASDEDVTLSDANTDVLSYDVGPLALPPTPAGIRALTELAKGEQWLVAPEQLDESGLLWRPGIRIGVRPESSFWKDAVGLPVIGVLHESTVPEALAVVNRLAGGGSVAIYANSAAELIPLLDGVQAATLCVGRPTTRTRIERQPGGSWGQGGIGLGALAGGPNRLVTLGSWSLQEGRSSSTLHLRGLRPEVRLLIEAAQPELEYAEFDRVRRAALSDSLAWRTELGGMRDVSGLVVERNLLRHWPVATQIRLAEGAKLAQLVRVVVAGVTVGAPIEVSTGEVLPESIAAFLNHQGITVSLERDDDWLTRIAATEALYNNDVHSSDPHSADLHDSDLRADRTVARVRLIGGDSVRSAEWVGQRGRVSLWAEPVTMAGPVELLVFLREQAISICAHKHGYASLPPGIEEWITDLQQRVEAARER